MEPVYNRGFLAIILMRALALDVTEAQEFLKLIEDYCLDNGYTITVERDED